MSAPAARIGPITLTVPDLAAAEDFYRDALGFMRAGSPIRWTSDRADLIGAPGAGVTALSLRLGAQGIDLLAFDSPGRSYPSGSTSSDLWFQHCAIVVGDMAAAFSRLAGFDAPAITLGGPQVLPPNTGSVAAYKFRDPFGHPLELLHFPAGVGDPAWQAPDGPLFRGIDHTAIAVSDTARSVSFYQAALDLDVTARSENAGPEQSRLDAVESARVDVVALSPVRATPHLELLGYRTGLRRPRPEGETAADIAVTRTLVEVDDLRAVRAASVREGTWDGRPAALISDPDGHVLLVIESRSST